MAAKVIHVEVTGRDGPKLQKFYSDVFGWTFDTNNPGGYGLYREANGLTSGVGADEAGGPGMVTFYVQAEDPEATLRKAEQMGGKIIMPLTTVAPDTTIALFSDPEGHVIGLM